MRAVLIPIADAANRDGDHAHPGKEAIIEGSLYGRSTVTAAINRLIAERWIEVEQWSNGRGQATVYRVLMDRPSSTPEPVTKPPVVPRCPSKEGARDWPLLSEKADAPALATFRDDRGQSEERKGPIEAPKAAGVPTWNATPTVNLSTETLPTVRAGVSDQGQQNQEPPTGSADELLRAVAAAAPPACRHELLADPAQAAGRAALRHRLARLAAAVGVDAAVAAVAGEWPTSVVSAMAHANARARGALEPGRPASGKFPEAEDRPPDPLDGVAAATVALGEHQAARAAEELAGATVARRPPDGFGSLRQLLHPCHVPAEADA